MSSEYQNKVNNYSKTIVCVGSGASLMQSDINLISNCTKIAINLSFRLMKDCDYLVASDYKFWLHHYKEIVTSTEAKLFTRSKLAAVKYKLNYLENNNKTVCSSGQLAIELALTLNPRKILLLGYDCSIKNGLHFHGKHIKELDNPTHKLTETWQRDLADLSKKANIKIINCSRYTELKCFEVSTLERELNIE